jgi:NADH:ubiquinone oxidoreductase subunit K
MNITSFGIYFAISLCILSVALIAYNSCIEGQNLILIIISLELFLLSIGVLLVHFSFLLDDMIGSVITLYLLPLAGAESAIALSILIAYYPKRGTLTIR